MTVSLARRFMVVTPWSTADPRLEKNRTLGIPDRTQSPGILDGQMPLESTAARIVRQFVIPDYAVRETVVRIEDKDRAHGLLR